VTRQTVSSQISTVFSRYYENRTGERFSALDSRLNSIQMEIDTISSSINATVSHVQSMYKYINIESSSCQNRLGRHTEDLQVVKNFIINIHVWSISFVKKCLCKVYGSIIIHIKY